LAALLTDTTNAYWLDAELGVYLIEALRTFGSLTQFWSDRGVFQATAGQAFYDLPTVLQNGSGEFIRSYNVTDANLVNTIEYHLLEPVTIPWTGTAQFTLADVVAGLQRRRDQFLIETGSVISQSTLPVPPTPIGRFTLPDTVIALRRMTWTTPEGYVSYVWRSDEWAGTAYSRLWNLDPKSPPDTWSMALSSPLTVQFLPPPSDSGNIQVLTVDAGAALNASGVLMGIPDDFTWIAKFGALSDLLNKDGPGRDPLRAEYCEKRYQDGIKIATAAAAGNSSVMQARINDEVVWSDSLYEVDAARPNWQNQQKTPDNATVAGLNLMALANIPDAVYGVTVDVVRNAVIPVLDSDPIQLGREEFDAVIGYAQHLACFKLGGAEFMASMPLYERFMRLAGAYNETVQALVRFEDPLEDRAAREESENPMRQRQVMA
jgi:hypothetical protein